MAIGRCVAATGGCERSTYGGQTATDGYATNANLRPTHGRRFRALASSAAIAGDEMGSGIVSGLIGGVISAALVAYFGARLRAAPTDGTLRYGWGMALLGLCCLAFAALAFGAFFYDNDVWTDRSEFFSVLALIIGLGAAAAYVFAEYFLVRGRCDDQRIEFHTPWTGRKAEVWSNLMSAEFDSRMSWYVLRFRSGSTIRISRLLSGHGAVLRKLEEMGYVE